MWSTVGSVGKPKQASIYNRVRFYRTELMKYMEPRFGLAEELISLSVLSGSDYEIVRSKHSVTEQNKQIISFVLKKPAEETH